MHYIWLDPYGSGKQDLSNFQNDACIRTRTQCFQMYLSGQAPSWQAQVWLFQIDGHDLHPCYWGRCVAGFLFPFCQNLLRVLVDMCSCQQPLAFNNGEMAVDANPWSGRWRRNTDSGCLSMTFHRLILKLKKIDGIEFKKIESQRDSSVDKVLAVEEWSPESRLPEPTCKQ